MWVHVLEQMGHENTLVVVSAMGKTTNAMESLVAAYFEYKNTKNKTPLNEALKLLTDFHLDISRDLLKMSLPQYFQKFNLY